MAIVATGQATLIDMNDSKQLVSYIGSSQSRTVIVSGSTYVPNYASTNNVLTPQLFIAGTPTDVGSGVTSTKWFYQLNGAGAPVEITATTTDYTLGAGTLKTLTLKTNLLTVNTTITYICELSYPDPDTGFTIVAKSEIEIVKVTNGNNGQNATVAILSNESDSVPSDSAGNNQVVTGVASTITVYEGVTDVTSSWSMGTPVVVGATGTLSGTPTNRTWTLNANGMSADTATVTWTLTRSGYANITKTFTISRVRNGVAGTSPTLYRCVASTDALQRNISGVYTPTTVTFTAKSQTGTGTYGNYSGRWIIEDTLDGTNWTVRTVNPTTDEATKTYTPSSTTIKAVRAKLHLAGGTTTLLDEQQINVVVDGATGQDSVYAYVWTPDGHTVRNSTGTLTAHVDVFKGANTVTGTAFKWYIQDPSATTVSGGDTDGGAGWRLLNGTYNAGTTGYATDTLTIPASAIIGTESFKCVVTYGGVKYTGVCTVSDLSDPILVRVDGLNIFKNGTGSVALRATLIQAGLEIDSAGTGGYTYTWSIYNEANVKTAFTATGKNITVNATDIDVRGNIVCEVSK